MPTIVFEDSYYSAVIRRLRSSVRTARSYDVALSLVMQARFGTSDAMSCAFRDLGWEAHDVIANFGDLQQKWAREHGEFILPWQWNASHRLTRIPTASRWMSRLPYLQGFFLRQVAALKPDVLYLHDVSLLSAADIRTLRDLSGALVVQSGGPYPGDEALNLVDLFVSPVPSHVERASAAGINSLYLPMAFDEREFAVVDQPRPIEVSFVGSVSPNHSITIPMLRSVAAVCSGLQIYGPPARSILDDPQLAGHYRGEAWGKNMYEIMSRSKISLNRHVDWAGPDACNMRLYEATGCGSALVTDMKRNLAELFDVPGELVAYSRPEIAGSLVERLLSDDAERISLAARGQGRTMHQHTYGQRMKVLSERLLAL